MTIIDGIPHYGKEAKLPGSEEDLQRACVQYLEWRQLLFFHPANGGSRNKIEAAKFKAMGVRAGVSDLVILEPFVAEIKTGLQSMTNAMTCAGLMVELKATGGKLSEHQTKFLQEAQKRGYAVAVVYTFDEFKKLIDGYLQTKTP